MISSWNPCILRHEGTAAYFFVFHVMINCLTNDCLCIPFSASGGVKIFFGSQRQPAPVETVAAAQGASICEINLQFSGVTALAPLRNN